jgi:hypothetical protein
MPRRRKSAPGAPSSSPRDRARADMPHDQAAGDFEELRGLLGDPRLAEAGQGSTPVAVTGPMLGSSALARAWYRFVETTHGRLVRGRAYLRAGAVLDLRVHRGIITAEVQGTRRYHVKIAVALPGGPPLLELRARLGAAVTLRGAALHDVILGAAQAPAAGAAPHRAILPVSRCGPVLQARLRRAVRPRGAPRRRARAAAGAARAGPRAERHGAERPHAAGRGEGPGGRPRGAVRYRAAGLAGRVCPGDRADAAAAVSALAARFALVARFARSASPAPPSSKDSPSASPPPTLDEAAEPTLSPGLELVLDAAPEFLADPEPVAGPAEVRREYLRELGIPTPTIDAWLREGVLRRTGRHGVYERTPEAGRRIAAHLGL